MTVRVFIQRDPNDKREDTPLVVQVLNGGGYSGKVRTRLDDFDYRGSKWILTPSNGMSMNECVHAGQIIVIGCYPQRRRKGDD